MTLWNDYGWDEDAPVRSPRYTGRTWCGRCHSYHSVDTGCDDGDEE